MDSPRVLIVGSSGILRPAAAALAADGAHVIGISLTGGVGSIAVDARDSGALLAALDGQTWSEALVYRPAVSEESLAFLRAATSGRCVVVLTSDDADPAYGDVAVPDDTLQLGWHTGDVQPWHSAVDVSDAALAVLADGAPRILGTIRPWSTRP